MNEDLYTIDGNTYRIGDRVSYDLADAWKSEMHDARNHIASEYSNKTDKDIIRELKKLINEPKTKTKEERVVDIISHDFENYFNMTIYEFQEIYDQILKNSPEKLI